MVYAFRRDAERHSRNRAWLVALLESDSAFALSELALSAVVRITTHPRVFRQPSPRADAVAFVTTLREHPQCRLVRPSPAHWPLFLQLCDGADARGNLITDAYHAALAIESGCTWITTR